MTWHPLFYLPFSTVLNLVYFNHAFKNKEEKYALINNRLKRSIASRVVVSVFRCAERKKMCKVIIDACFNVNAKIVESHTI